MRNYIYEARIVDAENDVVVIQVSGSSEEDMLEETGKSKWLNAVEKYETDRQADWEARQDIKNEDIEEKVGELGRLE